MVSRSECILQVQKRMQSKDNEYSLPVSKVRGNKLARGDNSEKVTR